MPDHIFITTTVNVSEMRINLRHILEDVCFRGRRYVVERAGEPMAVMLGVDGLQRTGARGASRPG